MLTWSDLRTQGRQSTRTEIISVQKNCISVVTPYEVFESKFRGMKPLRTEEFMTLG